MEYNVKSLLKRRDRAVAKTAQWETLLRYAYKYAVPNRNVYEMTSPGSNLNFDVYDSTLALATRKFVHNTINALMPSNSNFLRLVAGSSVPEDEAEEVNKQLQKVTDIFFKYLRQSNFDQVISEAFVDMAISTGVMQINEGDKNDPLIFSSVPSDKISFETGPRGEFSAFFRDWCSLPIDYAKELWGDDFRVPDEYTHKSDVLMQLYEISYYCYKDKIYKYVVIDSGTQELCYSREEQSWEWVAFRLSKLPGEDRGRGPVLDALPSAATINKAVEDELVAAALQASPVYMAYTNAIVNPYNFRIAPNEIIAVNPTGSDSWPIAPLPSAGNINFTAMVVQDLRNQINEIMMTQPLIPLIDGSARTATEVAVTQNTIRENASAAYGRIQRELFDPIVDRVLYILRKKGLIGDVKVDNKIISIKYSTPLAQSIEMADLERFNGFYQMLVGMYGPEVALSLIDSKKMPRWIGSKINTDLSLIKDEAQINQMISEASKMQQRAQEEQVNER